MTHRYTTSYPIQVGYSETMIHEAAFHAHTEYEIYYFHHGKCTYLIGDQIYVLAPGDLILMHGMTLHCPKVDAELPYRRTIIHFDAKYVQSMLHAPFSLNALEPFEKLRNHRFHLTESEQAYVKQSLELLEDLQGQTQGVSQHRFHALFLDLLYFIYGLSQKPMENQISSFSQKEHYAQQIIAYLECHYQEDIDLDMLQEHIHISKYYLAKLFKEVTGFTIFNYLYQKRINQAKVLFMIEKGITVSEVCYRTGFKNPAHFSRLFKQIAGCTPDQFRKISNPPLKNNTR